MRTILLLICTLSFSLTYAQLGGGQGGPPGGGGQRGGQGGGGQQERPEIRAFKALEVAGIFSYDDAEVIKKIKLNKKDEKLIVGVRKAINNYNRKVQEIGLLNKDNFDTLNVYVNTMMKARMSSRGQNRGGNQQQSGSRGNDDQDDFRELIKKKIEPAKRAVQDEENKLNRNLEELFDEKQYKKWLKYQKNKKEELNPKPQSNNNQNSQMRSGGGGQGGPPRGRGMR